MTILIWSLLVILWFNAGVRATREMEEVDGDAMEWITFPFLLKIGAIAIAPILFLIYERHILVTKPKDKNS